MKIYLIGSLRNPAIPKLANNLRKLGYDIFDDWFAAGPDADDAWRDYERERGHNLEQALSGRAAIHVFQFDKYHLDTSDMGILLLPAGKSGHIEIGYLIGQNKPCFIVYPEEPERFDVMYLFATRVFDSTVKLLDYLEVNHEQIS